MSYDEDIDDHQSHGQHLLRSTNGAATWSPEENVSRSGGLSSTPLLAATTHYLHIIWLDERKGRFKIWYDRRVLR